MLRRDIIKAGALFIFAPKFEPWFRQKIITPEHNLWVVTADGRRIPVKANWTNIDGMPQASAEFNNIHPNTVIIGIETKYHNIWSQKPFSKPYHLQSYDTMQIIFNRTYL